MNSLQFPTSSDYLNYVLIMTVGLMITLPLAWKFSNSRRKRGPAFLAFDIAVCAPMCVAIFCSGLFGMFYSVIAMLMLFLFGMMAMVAE